MSDSAAAAQHAFYRAALEMLTRAEIPFLVSGSFAFEFYTGIARSSKDFDIFVRRSDIERVLALFAGAGYRTEVSFTHWLGKIFSAEHFIDVIFNSGNGLCEVDDGWFKRAQTGEILGMRVRYCSPEDMIWSKAFIMERERYDGADIAHLLRTQAEHMDWTGLVARFGPHWRVLLGHLVLFGFVYPTERARIPEWVMRRLIGLLERELKDPEPGRHVCQGTLLSRIQYHVDIECWGYEDPRLAPAGNMTQEETERWTAAATERK